MADLLYAISAVLLIMSVAFGAATAHRARRRAQMRRRLREQLRGIADQRQSDDASRWDGPLARLGAQWLRGQGENKEIARLLAQAGWHRQQDQAVYFGLQLLLPAVGILIVLFVWFTVFDGGIDLGFAWALLTGFAGAFLAPRYLLRYLARQRLARTREEVPMVAQLLKVLFEAGLGLDQALLTVATDHADLVPELAHELRPVLRQVKRGADRGEALADMARLLDLQDLTDLITLLRQVDRYGGNVQQPLRGFVDLLEDRRRAEIQERVGKLSGTMTIVMVLFLFPALLVFLAGPGFIAILRMLTGMGE
jgi:tight adherence protein C